jgi:glycosyltransferase involved in cell wall biosynthesis
MRILYLSQYFPPEVGATQTRAYEMARGLLKAGHQVTIIAEFPNHPHGVIPPEYRGKWHEWDTLDGIDVLRVWVKTSPVKSFRSRLTFYLSYMFMAAFAGIFLARGKYDAIYATSPPLFVGGAALLISYLRRLPLFFEVRDLWPESAVALGELNNPRAIRWATRLEEACYRRARRVIVTTQEMIDHLTARGFAPSHFQLIRNGANTDLFRFSTEKRRRLRAELGVEGKFVVGYAGLLGIAQGLESVLETAQQLQTEEEDNILFLFIGDGPMKAQLQENALRMNLTNVRFLPAQPRADIPGYLSAADVVLVPLIRQRLIGALPSKMFDAMACKRPVVLSAEGEAAAILQEAEAGIVLPPQDSSALASALRQLKQDAGQREQYGENGRRTTVAHYSRQAQAAELVRMLEEELHLTA